MSNYSLAVQWNQKDGLADNNPDKVVSGDDFNTEFLAVKTAVNSKADLDNTVQTITAATASSGTNTNQVATTAFVQTAVAKAAINDLVYPVGSIYTTVGSLATTPAEVNTLLGVGTWVAFGAGKVPVGIDSSDTDFDAIKETGGSKTHTLTVAEMPSHNHSISPTLTRGSGTDGNPDVASGGGNQGTFSISNTGGGDAHNNLQPYIVVYMWERTA